MPPEWRLHVLEARLSAETDVPALVKAVGLADLDEKSRATVMDAIIVHRADFPVVLVGDLAVCVGELDIAAVLAAVRGSHPVGEAKTHSAG